MTPAVESHPVAESSPGQSLSLGPTRRGPVPRPSSTPLLPLQDGEQYRFRFDMEACVGCHSCEVACVEQNATDVARPWRQVGEIESGEFPTTQRFSLSMACNHCVEPTCLSGCPTKAYEKLANGIVVHHAEECVGCQYCIWNCPYEVPVFSASTGVVSKCDMCRPRLEAGQEPACVGACPTRALTVEPVDVARWRDDHAEADGPGLPPSDITLSTTAVVVAPAMAEAAARGKVRTGDDHRVEPEDPHWPLVVLTLLTQVALGAMATTVVLDRAGTGSVGGGAVSSLVAGTAALAASLFHLGRPARAFKAMRNLATSWLSREVALFGAFSLASLAYAVASAVGAAAGPRLVLGGLAVGAGTAGVYASARLYLVPARPVWNSARTPVSFYATAVSTGPLVALLSVDRAAAPVGLVAALVGVALVATLVQVGVHVHLVRATRARTDRQHRGTGLLLARLRDLVLVRMGVAALAVVLLVSVLVTDLGGPGAGGRLVAAVVVVGVGEVVARYLFYVTVVPFRVAGSFFAGSRT